MLIEWQDKTNKGRSSRKSTQAREDSVNLDSGCAQS